MALAPVAVAPAYQGQGIGSALMEEAHQKAAALGHTSIVLLGEPAYYRRFGYAMARDFGIQIPFDEGGDYSMVLALQPNAWEGVKGEVIYLDAFYE